MTFDPDYVAAIEREQQRLIAEALATARRPPRRVYFALAHRLSEARVRNPQELADWLASIEGAGA